MSNRKSRTLPVVPPTVEIAPEVEGTIEVLSEPQALVVAEPDSAEFDPAANPPKPRGSVIAPLYKKLHQLDALATEVSATVRTGPNNTVDEQTLAMLASRNGLDAQKWAHLNIGMQVMALTNVLRARQRKGEEIVLSV